MSFQSCSCLTGFQTALMDLLQSSWFKIVSCSNNTSFILLSWRGQQTIVAMFDAEKVIYTVVSLSVHTLAELKMTGNCLKGSRPLLSFDPVSKPLWDLNKRAHRPFNCGCSASIVSQSHDEWSHVSTLFHPPQFLEYASEFTADGSRKRRIWWNMN